MAEEKNWKPLDLVKVTADYLATKDVPNPRLDAELLLCRALGLERRVDIYAGFEREVSGKELAAYREMIRRRSAREPVSRILGEREFMGIRFLVTPDVLSPRPETELLVESALEAVKPRAEPAAPETEEIPEAPPTEDDGQPMTAEMEKILDSYAEDVEDDEWSEAAPATPAATRAAPAPKMKARKQSVPPAASAREVAVLDLGCGSGCIAVAVAAMLPGARVTAVDASAKALAVATENAKRAKIDGRVAFRKGDWFSACGADERFDLILSNPPYLVKGDPEIWPEVSRYDPEAALYAGPDGLDAYRAIVPAARGHLRRGGWLFLEVGAGQAARVAAMLGENGFSDIAAVRDYAGTERIVRGRG